MLTIFIRHRLVDPLSPSDLPYFSIPYTIPKILPSIFAPFGDHPSPSTSMLLKNLCKTALVEKLCCWLERTMYTAPSPGGTRVASLLATCLRLSAPCAFHEDLFDRLIRNLLGIIPSHFNIFCTKLHPKWARGLGAWPSDHSAGRVFNSTKSENFQSESAQ